VYIEDLSITTSANPKEIKTSATSLEKIAISPDGTLIALIEKAVQLSKTHIYIISRTNLELSTTSYNILTSRIQQLELLDVPGTIENFYFSNSNDLAIVIKPSLRLHSNRIYSIRVWHLEEDSYPDIPLTYSLNVTVSYTFYFISLYEYFVLTQWFSKTMRAMKNLLPILHSFIINLPV
jgi:hypothetical protein